MFPRSGDFGTETRYGAEPGALLAKYRDFGADWLHVVDLDGARDGNTANLEIIAELARQGKTILYISHVLEVTEKVCSRVIMLYQGKIVANDEVGRLRDLMHLPSLEQIFRQLARQEDVGGTAREIVAVMREA